MNKYTKKIEDKERGWLGNIGAKSGAQTQKKRKRKERTGKHSDLVEKTRRRLTARTPRHKSTTKIKI